MVSLFQDFHSIIEDDSMALVFNKEKAKQAGYTDQEIGNYLNTGQAPVRKSATAFSAPSKEALQQAMVQDLARGGKNVTELNTVYNNLYSTSATENKNKDAYNASLNFINNLEKRYLQAGGGTFGKGLGARVKGLETGLQARLGYNDAAQIYLRERAGFAATLKQLTGDTGVMTQKDYQRLAGLVADLGATPVEATGLFDDLRNQLAAKFGGSATPSSLHEALTQPQTSSQTPGLTFQQEQRPQGLPVQSQGQPPLKPPQIKQQTGTAPGGPNWLADIFLPRAAAIARKDITGKPVPTEERIGVGGEALNRLVGPFLGPLGFAAGGAIEGATKPGADIGERALGGAIQGGGQLVGAKALGLFGKLGIGQVEARGKTAAKLTEEGLKIGNKETQKVAKRIVKEKLQRLDPEYGDLISKLAKESLNPSEALKLSVRAGQQAHTLGGHPRLTQLAGYYSLLDQALNKELTQVAPKIMAQTANLARGFKTGKRLKTAAFYGGLTAGGLAGLGYLWNLLSGRGLPGANNE